MDLLNIYAYVKIYIMRLPTDKSQSKVSFFNWSNVYAYKGSHCHRISLDSLILIFFGFKFAIPNNSGAAIN